MNNLNKRFSYYKTFGMWMGGKSNGKYESYYEATNIKYFVSVSKEYVKSSNQFASRNNYYRYSG